MSVRYTYNRQVSPPAPFVHVTVARPDGSGISASDVPAQLDTGADFSVIPARLVEQLSLVQLDEARVGGFGGQVSLLPTFVVSLAVQPFEAFVLRVVADRHEPYVILGRDMLNRFRIDLDGPNLVFELRTN